MEFYIKDTGTSEILILEAPNYANLAKLYRKSPYMVASDNEKSAKMLEDAKSLKKIEVSNSRKDFIYSPIEYNNSTFINTEIAGNNLQAAFTFLDEPINWLDIEGNSIILSTIQVRELVVVIINKRSQGYFREASLNASLDACVSVEEVEQLDISF